MKNLIGKEIFGSYGGYHFKGVISAGKSDDLPLTILDVDTRRPIVHITLSDVESLKEGTLSDWEMLER